MDLAQKPIKSTRLSFLEENCNFFNPYSVTVLMADAAVGGLDSRQYSATGLAYFWLLLFVRYLHI